jgi:hypothetical protein
MARTYVPGQRVLVVRKPDQIDDWWMKRYPGYKPGDKVEARCISASGIVRLLCDMGGEPSVNKITIVDEKNERIERMQSLDHFV